MNMDSEARGWGRKDVPDGTRGVVTAANTYTSYRGRIYEFGRTPGVYRSNGAFTVTWENGERTQPGAGDLMWVDGTLAKIRRDDKEGNLRYETDTYLHPLPKTIVPYEGDVVELMSADARAAFGERFARVERISWHHLHSLRNDGSPMPIFDCQHLDRNYGRMSFDVTEVRLHERGNVWKWYTGKRKELVFASLRDEIAFHSALGLREQIRCPQTGNYEWPAEYALEAARSGLIDVLAGQAGFFGAAGIVIAYKFTDRSLSDRARAYFIQEFSKES